MPAQEISGTELTDVVTVELTRAEVRFLRSRCQGALSVMRSNYYAEKDELTKEHLQAQTHALISLMTKLKESLG